MENTHKNWYLWLASFGITLWLILILKIFWDELIIIKILFLGAAGIFMLLSSVLTKKGCIISPIDSDIVSKDETIQRNFYFYLDLIMSVLFFLSAIISCYMHYEVSEGVILIVVLSVRFIFIYCFKWFLGNSKKV